MPMNLEQLSAGNALPDDFNVVIEISARGNPVKYEVDKKQTLVKVNKQGQRKDKWAFKFIKIRFISST